MVTSFLTLLIPYPLIWLLCAEKIINFNVCLQFTSYQSLSVNRDVPSENLAVAMALKPAVRLMLIPGEGVVDKKKFSGFNLRQAIVTGRMKMGIIRRDAGMVPPHNLPPIVLNPGPFLDYNMLCPIMAPVGAQTKNVIRPSRGQGNCFITHQHQNRHNTFYWQWLGR
jgi:hypothetical protein